MSIENRTLPSGEEVILPRGKAPDRYKNLTPEERDQVYKSLLELSGDLEEKTRGNLGEEVWEQIASPKLDYALKKPAEALKGMPVSQAILEAMKQQGLKEGGLSGRTPEQLMYFCLNYLQNAPENRQGEKGIGVSNMDKVGPDEWVEIFKVEGRWKLRVIAADEKTVRMSGFLFPPKQGKEAEEEIVEEKTEGGEEPEEKLTHKEKRKERREERRERRKERRENRRARRGGERGTEEESEEDFEDKIEAETIVDSNTVEDEQAEQIDAETVESIQPEPEQPKQEDEELKTTDAAITEPPPEAPSKTTTELDKTHPEPTEPTSKVEAPVTTVKVTSSEPKAESHEPDLTDISLFMPKIIPGIGTKVEELGLGSDGFEKIFRAMSEAEKLLEKANLGMPKEAEITPEKVADYRARAHEFREGLVAREPRLEPMQQFFNVMIPFLEKEIKSVDLAQIKSKEDLVRVMNAKADRFEEKMKPYESTFDEEEVKDLIKNGNMEVVLAFFMSGIQEVGLIAMEHVNKDPGNAKRVMQVLTDERVVE